MLQVIAWVRVRLGEGYVLFKTRVGVHVLSDIKREAQPSVLYLIKHDNECFE